MIPLTENECTVTDSFHFAEEICKQDRNLHMANLDVDSLSTNIRLDETIDICIDSLHNDNENTTKIPKDVFCNLLNVATKESFLMFKKKFYKQIDGVAMRSRLGPALANMFMYSFGDKWPKDCPHGLKPVFYRRMLMTYLYCFPLSIMQKRLKGIYLANIPT